MKSPKPFIKLLSLIVCAVLALIAFQIEDALLQWRYSAIDVRYCFLIIPALFAVWLVAFCRVRAAWWRWLVFAASYAAWFCLSYIFYLSLISWHLGSVAIAAFFGDIWDFVIHTFRLQDEAFVPLVYATLVLCAVGVYALFVAENIAVKKLFRLSFKKADWILLFAHPVLVALFALPVHLTIILAAYGTEKLNWLWDIDTYFLQGTLIAGYLMTEGVIFVRGMKGEPQ